MWWNIKKQQLPKDPLGERKTQKEIYEDTIVDDIIEKLKRPQDWTVADNGIEYKLKVLKIHYFKKHEAWIKINAPIDLDLRKQNRIKLKPYLDKIRDFYCYDTQIFLIKYLIDECDYICTCNITNSTGTQISELKNWCDKNCEGNWHFSGTILWMIESDYIAFKIRWMT